MSQRPTSRPVTLALETIGTEKPWVARVVGPDDRFGLQREFLRPKKDYARANSVGSRGVISYFHLYEGHLYEVNSPQTWKGVRRYFCYVHNRELVELPAREVYDHFEDPSYA